MNAQERIQLLQVLGELLRGYPLNITDSTKKVIEEKIQALLELV